MVTVTTKRIRHGREIQPVEVRDAFGSAHGGIVGRGGKASRKAMLGCEGNVPTPLTHRALDAHGVSETSG